MISRRISLLPVAMHSWSSSWLDLFDSAADTVGPYHKSVPYFLLVKNPDFFHLSAHREVGPYHHKGVNLEWCKPGQVAPFSFSRLEEGRVTLRRQWAGVLPGKESVCLLRTVSEEEAGPLSRRASRGLAGSHLALTTPLEALRRWPAGSLVLRLSRCLPRPGASLSPHFLLFWAVNTFVLT